MRSLFLLSAMFLLVGSSALAGDDVPAWLRQASLQPTPGNYPKDVPAVVLLDERRVAVEEDGKVTTTTHYAVRVLNREGREYAFAKELYRTDSGKVRDIRAWLLRPNLEPKKYGKDQTLDASMVEDDVYNEVRLKFISATDDADAGSVFGFETVSEDRSVFTQFEWQFQDRLPTLQSRFLVDLPTGWRAESVTFNRAKIEPVVAGTSYTWELRDLPPILHEPARPPVTTLAPRVGVSFFAPTGKSTMGKSFANWTDVSVWLSEMSDPQAAPNDALTTKARELTAGAKTDFEKIQAIGNFVQKVRYVSIQTGLGRGGGYRPHGAGDVFAKSYGDCKDKANLMRAMLKTLGITAWPIAIYSGDASYVQEGWPSPQQFNHCIIAVKVDDAVTVPTTIKHPTLGKLLIFDPTDDLTPVGDLPDHEQGSFALLVAGPSGGLWKMPVTTPETNALQRQTEVVLFADGSISAQVREQATGQAAVTARREMRAKSHQDYLKLIERWVTQSVTGAKTTKIEPSDAMHEGRFNLAIDFAAATYGQLMQQRLLVFKPAVVSRHERLVLTEASRKYPVQLDSEAFQETVRVKLPEGFAVDELPDPVKLETAFGQYSANCEVKDGQLHFTRRLNLKTTTIPPEQYGVVRTFFEKIRAAETSPVVLARK
ncbi:MAG: DUF3857 domain-containing protein [Blastocatellia bacterium]|nr:DUF3857 domain-containing protein [Blastocatellia bacterium]